MGTACEAASPSALRVDVARGEKVLAWTDGHDGRGPGRHPRRALPRDGTRLAWEQVEAADWDRDTDVFRVSEVGTWGEPAPSTGSRSPSPAGCSSWSASGSPPASCCSATCRSRPPRPAGDRPPRPPATGGSWVYEYDEGVDPDDPAVRPAAEALGGPATTSGWISRGSATLANLCGLHRSPVAQLAEHSAVNRRVVGSSPTGGASLDGGSITGQPSCCLQASRGGDPGRR